MRDLDRALNLLESSAYHRPVQTFGIKEVQGGCEVRIRGRPGLTPGRDRDGSYQHPIHSEGGQCIDGLGRDFVEGE